MTNRHSEQTENARRRRENSLNTKIWECDVCERKFARKQQMARHIEAIHRKQDIDGGIGASSEYSVKVNLKRLTQDDVNRIKHNLLMGAGENGENMEKNVNDDKENGDRHKMLVPYVERAEKRPRSEQEIDYDSKRYKVVEVLYKQMEKKGYFDVD